MNKDSKILITGAAGMAGSAVVRKLSALGYHNVKGTDKREYNLLNSDKVKELFDTGKFEYVFHIAAKVGGINANNTKSGEFIYENLTIQNNVIENARIHNVKKLLFCGSACIYPKNIPMPIREESLLSGKLEETNRGYAIAKIAGITLCQMYRKQYGCDFISVMPTNLYGIGDNFNLIDSHVLPALMMKFHLAKENGDKFIKAWGTGNPRREFLFVDDLAEALIFLMDKYSGSDPVNIGTGEDVSIKELVKLISEIVRYKGDIIWDATYPDGVYERRLDVSKINDLGWKAHTPLYAGISATYQWLKDNFDNVRR